MVLVAELELDFVQFRVAMVEAVGTAEPGFLNGDDVANGAVVDSPNGLSIAGMVPALESGHDAELLLLGQGTRGGDPAHADRIDGVRLFYEGVLPASTAARR